MPLARILACAAVLVSAAMGAGCGAPADCSDARAEHGGRPFPTTCPRRHVAATLPTSRPATVPATVILDCSDQQDDLVALTGWVGGPPAQERRQTRLYGDYAVCMIWPGGKDGEPAERPRRLYLYDNVRKRVYATDDFGRFVEWVRALPTGSDIQRIESCSAPFSWGMPPGSWQALEDVMASRRHRWSRDPLNGLRWTIVCTCEQRVLIFPDGWRARDY